MSQNGDQIGISGNAFARGIPAMTVTWTGPSSASHSATIFNRVAKGYDRDITAVNDSEGNWQRETHKNDRVELSIECKIISTTQTLARVIAADPPIKGQTVTISGATDSTLNSANWIVASKPEVSYTPEGETVMSLQLVGRLVSGSIGTISNLGSGRIGFNAGPTLIHDEVSENTRTGSDFQQTFRGTLTEARAARDTARAEGASQISIRPIGDGEYETLSMFPYNENGVEAVPLPSIHELEVDVERAPWTSNLILLAELSISEILQLRKVIEEYQAGKYDTTETGETAQGNAELDCDDIAGDTGIEVFRLVAGFGADSFIQYSSVYRRTLTAATPAQVTASRVGEAKIWTTAEVLTKEGLNNDFFALDSASQWLKSRCQVIAVANQKTQVVYTYTETYKASRLLYAPYAAAVLFNAYS